MSNSAFTTTGIGGGGTGTVTSIGITSSSMTVTNTPITTSGDINIEIETGIIATNLLYNPALRFWQRGTAASVAVAGGTTQYSADRWQVRVVGGGCSGFAVRSAGPRTGLYYAKVGRTAANAVAGTISFAQTIAIEDCLSVAGKKVSIHIKVKAGANYSAAAGALQLELYSGTGATDTSVFNTFAGSNLEIDQALILTAADQTFTFTSGTLGATVTQLAYKLVMVSVGVAGADDSFYVAEAKVEVADNATEFQYPNHTQEFQRCMYRMQKSFNIDTTPATGVGAASGESRFGASQPAGGVQRTPLIPFRPIMSATPTIVFYNPVNANTQAHNATRGQDCANTTLTASGPNGYEYTCTGSAATSQSDDIGLHWTAISEIT